MLSPTIFSVMNLTCSATLVVFEGNKSQESVKGHFLSPPEILGLRKKQNYLFSIQMIVLCLLNRNEKYQNSYVAPAV